VVRQRQSAPGRRVSRTPGQSGPAGGSLDESVVPRQAGVRSGATVAGQRHTDDALVDVPEVSPGQAQLLWLIAAQVAEDSVGAADESFEDLATGRILEVKEDAP